jgi:hypothetical protein
MITFAGFRANPAESLGLRGGCHAPLCKMTPEVLAKMEPDDQKLLLHMAQKVGRS